MDYSFLTHCVSQQATSHVDVFFVEKCKFYFLTSAVWSDSTPVSYSWAQDCWSCCGQRNAFLKSWLVFFLSFATCCKQTNTPSSWHSWLILTNCETEIMTLRLSDWHSENVLDSIHKSCDVFFDTRGKVNQSWFASEYDELCTVPDHSNCFYCNSHNCTWVSGLMSQLVGNLTRLMRG